MLAYLSLQQPNPSTIAIHPTGNRVRVEGFAQLERRSVEHARKKGNDLLKWVADQAYFFLRDLTHKHQHHSLSSDTILILQERHRDELGWRKNIIFSLQYYIIRSKRFGDVESIYQAQGVLGYCMSFRAICDHVLADKAKTLPIYNDDALIQSLDARAKAQTTRRAEIFERRSIAAYVRTFVLLSVTILVALLIMLVQPVLGPEHQTEPLSDLHRVSNFAVEHFFLLLGFIATIWAAGWIRTHRDWHVGPPFFRSVLEMANADRMLASILLIALLVGVGIATYSLGYDALENLKVVASQAKGLVLDLWHAHFHAS